MEFIIGKPVKNAKCSTATLMAARAAEACPVPNFKAIHTAIGETLALVHNLVICHDGTNSKGLALARWGSDIKGLGFIQISLFMHGTVFFR